MSARFESACIELTPESSEPLLPAATTKAHFSRSITPTRCRVPALPSLFTTRRPVERKVLSLKRFIKAYSSLFPLCVSIEEGYCNSSLGCELSAGECYTLNFTTTTRSVVVSDGRGKQDTIPMNSHVEYTFLYNPEGNLERAKSGYILPTVRDILDGRRARPDVVCATRSYKGGNEAASVEESEVIVILKQKRRRSGSGILAVYSITFGMVKLLPSQCRGDFTTNPYATKLRITEILGHIEKRFPAKACLFLAPEFDSEVDRNLLDDTVDVLGLQCTNSVAASLSAHGDESLIGLSSHWIEIPSNLPITVSFHCNKNSKSAAKDRPLVAETACRRKSEALDHREPHVVVDGPAYNYQPLIEAKDPDIADALYEVAGPSATTRRVSSDICLGVKAIEKSLQDTNDLVGVLIKEMHSLQSYVECNSHHTVCDNQLSMHQAISPHCTDTIPADPKLSKLSELSVQQVCILLENLGLPQYKAIFAKERISGIILSQLTEDDLRGELKISSRLHRLKLLEVISGVVNPGSLLSESFAIVPS